MRSFFLETLIYPGSGFVFSRLLIDLIAFASLLYVVWNIFIPVLRHYRLGIFLEGLCGKEPRHWFYGHVLKYPYSEKGINESTKRVQKFPYVCTNWVGPFLAEFLTHHAESVKPVISSDASKYELAYKCLRPWIGDGLLISSGKKWRRNRRLITPAFHYNILKPYLKIFNSCSKVFLRKMESQVDTSVEISEKMSLMTLDTMLQCAMSFKTDCQNTTGKHPYVGAVKEITKIIIKRYENPHLLIDWMFNLSSEGRRMKIATKVVHDQAELIIKRRKQILAQERSEIKDASSTRKKAMDFLDILLETKDEDGKGLSDSEIRDEVDTFLFEGHDTTASALSWILYNLAKYPKFQEKCREEITYVLQQRDDVEWDDLSQLSYLTMFIKESLRLYPAVPFIARTLNKPMKFPKSDTSEITIPANVNVSVSIFVAHRNPLVWEDAEKFDPERFTFENISKRSPHAYIPFSSGPRNCIGQNFAMNEMKVMVCQVLKTYRLYLDDDTPPPLMKPDLVLWSENGIFIKFENLVQ